MTKFGTVGNTHVVEKRVSEGSEMYHSQGAGPQPFPNFCDFPHAHGVSARDVWYLVTEHTGRVNDGPNSGAGNNKVN